MYGSTRNPPPHTGHRPPTHTTPSTRAGGRASKRRSKPLTRVSGNSDASEQTQRRRARVRLFMVCGVRQHHEAEEGPSTSSNVRCGNAQGLTHWGHRRAPDWVARIGFVANLRRFLGLACTDPPARRVPAASSPRVFAGCRDILSRNENDHLRWEARHWLGVPRPYGGHLRLPSQRGRVAAVTISSIRYGFGQRRSHLPSGAQRQRFARGIERCSKEHCGTSLLLHRWRAARRPEGLLYASARRATARKRGSNLDENPHVLADPYSCARVTPSVKMFISARWARRHP